MKSLADMRNYLLPGLWALDPEKAADIIANSAEGRLDLVIAGKATPLLTREEIESNQAVALFAPRVRAALERREKVIPEMPKDWWPDRVIVRGEHHKGERRLVFQFMIPPADANVPAAWEVKLEELRFAMWLELHKETV